MPKFRKKPVVIEAVQITRPMTIETPEGTMRGNPGDWLITGVRGEQYFCKDDIFRTTYEVVEETDLAAPTDLAMPSQRQEARDPDIPQQAHSANNVRT